MRELSQDEIDKMLNDPANAKPYKKFKLTWGYAMNEDGSIRRDLQTGQPVSIHPLTYTELPID